MRSTVPVPIDTFLIFWRKLNTAVTTRGEPQVLHGEAREWYGRADASKTVDDRLVNRLLNQRKPI